ncbi:MAG: hypothetical protein QM730_15405 [Anaerolineales bacterium]
MSFFTRFVVACYAKLLNLYPRKFRDEFAVEMHTVFSNSVMEAAEQGIPSVIDVCRREFLGMPFNILKEFWHQYQGKELIMLPENTPGPPATIGQVAMGTLPFFVFGIVMILLELPFALQEQAWFNAVGNFFFLTWLLLPAIGFGVGWVQDFPRWSYPYAGMAVVLAFYIQNASTPGLNFFGIPLFGRELWEWRAWVPLAAAFVIALIISRSFKPFIHFFINLWNDWSIPSYLMAIALPLLVMIAFDEMDQLYSLYFMIAFAVLFTAMVILYLQSQKTWQKVLALTIGILVITFSAVLGSNSYWLSHDGMYLSGAREMLLLAGKIALVMLIPAWLELIRRSAGRLRIV